MARNQYSFEKRRREIEKKKKKEEKKERKLDKKDSPTDGDPDSPATEGSAEVETGSKSEADLPGEDS